MGSQVSRLNTVVADGPRLPSRFEPSRDKSLSHEKLFDQSRSRNYSASEFNALSKSREDDFGSISKGEGKTMKG